MERDHQNVRFGREPHERGPPRRASSRIERTTQLLDAVSMDLIRVAPIAALEVAMLANHLAEDLLVRHPVLAYEDRTQCLVPPRDGIERAAKRHPVQRALDLERTLQVMHRGARRELVEEPHALLRERQWQETASLVALEEWSTAADGAIDPRGLGRDRGLVEQERQRDLE